MAANTAGDDLGLEPEQEQLLIEMVAAARVAPREKQVFHLIDTDQGGDILLGPGGNRPVLARDVHALSRAGLLDASLNYRDGNAYVITAKGRRWYEQVHRRAEQPFEQIEQRIRGFLESPDFRSAYPEAYAHWRAAAELLLRSDGTDGLTTIGYEAREAMQDFATALVQRHAPSDVVDDPTKTKDRVSAVFLMYRADLGDKRRKMLDALFNLWSASVDLVQRQTHGGLKEGEPLSWDDGRRVVFQTANVMVEIHLALADIAEPRRSGEYL